MHLTRYLAKSTAITLVLFMIASMLTIIPAQAQYKNMQEGGSVSLPAGVTPDVTVKADAYLSFRPTSVGVGQTILVNMWVSPALHVSRYFTGFKVTITKADGTKDVITMNSYRADTTAWFEYIADQVGTWKLKFDFPGAYFPAGNYTVYPGAFAGASIVNFPQSCYYTASSTTEQELTVQTEPVLSWPPSPLPTDYWTRPIAFDNREWWSIAGNYPWYGPADGGPNWETLWNERYPDTTKYASPRQGFVPWVQAPNTAHVSWKRQNAISGIAGGDLGTWGIFTSGSNPLMIYAGRAYQVATKPFNGVSQSIWQCSDLRTGELIWEMPVSFLGNNVFGVATTTAPTVIEYEKGTPEIPGGEASGWNQRVNLLYIGGGRLLKYDPWSGAMTGNFSIAPLMSATYYRNGYALGVQDLGAAAAPNRYRLINWTTFTTTTNFTARIMNNITWPWSSLGTAQDFEANVAAWTTALTPAAVGAYYGTQIRGASLITGQQLFDVSVEETMYSGSCTVADHGKVAALMMSGSFMAWDLASGKLAWTSEKMDYPWDASGFGAYAVQSAYGMLFRQAYSGVYAFDWTNGKIVWKYEAPTPYEYETPYTGRNGTGVYSFDPFSSCGIIADGKMYVVSSEHTPTEPVTRGWGLHCINATTGKGIWFTTGAWGFSITLQDPISTFPGPIADGYLVASASNGYNYAFGKGKSKTTIEGPFTAVPKGNGIVIKGTVLDQSPAQPNTPCVAKESMTTQMEYLHMQRPIDGIKHDSTITGVPVSLTAMSTNGSYFDLGTLITDGYYGTFSKTWTPPVEGDYKIIASFAGDDSYGSSAASTTVSVGSATETPATGVITVPDYTMTIIFGVIAIIIAVAIATVVIILMSRKR
ncbi:MAG TPA: PQQ-binding-like beta-propeller repeat protein [Candidatus Sulfotelmatobacter sp.]|nr:PQQ-binding-like beta-propeller repeat protein [Candidatus Sulfotelmatobacter sp.]